MPDPRVSFVVTCFNLGEFLGEAIESVRRQTCRDYELLIVDDGSTEPSTIEVLTRLTADGLRVIRTPNRGLPAARNAGISAVQSEFICCLDADDRLLPEYLERSISALDASPEVAFASHWVRTFGDQEGEWKPERCDFPVLLDLNCVNGAALVRRAAVAEVGGYDESFTQGCEDWDLWITLTERGRPGVIIPEMLFEYRRRPGSMSRTMLQQVGHPAMYERIVRKHANTFATHLLPLLNRRYRDRAETRKHLAALTAEAERWLQPELRGLRDDVRMLEDQLTMRREAAALQAHAAGLTSELAEAKALTAALTSELAATRELATNLRLRLTEAANSLAYAANSTADLHTALDVRTREQKVLTGSLAEERLALETAKVAFDAISEDVRKLRARAEQSEAENTAIRASWSWTLTKPLRRLYEIVAGNHQ